MRRVVGAVVTVPTRSGLPWRARVMDDQRAATLGALARLLAVLAVALFVLGAWWWGIPSSGESRYAEALVQFAVLALYAIGIVVSLRFLATGATIMAVTAVGVGALSAVQLEPVRGLVVAMVLFLPAALLWVVWQRSHGRVRVSVLAVGLVVLLSGGWLASDQIFAHFYGPKAPVSATGALPVDQVTWMWTGGLTPTSAFVTARLQGPVSAVGLDITSGDPLLDGTISVATSTPDADDDIRMIQLSNLTPETTYEYAVTVSGEADSSRGQGQFTTPALGTSSFTFTFGSCARLGSNAATYDSVAEADPLFHLITGDFFYGDIARNDVSLYADAYARQLTPGAPAALYREVPIAYMWDDHDFGPNDADRTSPSREAAWKAYRTYVPHYSLGDRVTSGAIYQAFTIGRARFVLADLRSERDPATVRDGPDKTMLGQEQRKWLERELLRSSRRHAVVFWVSSVPWIENSTAPGDNWGAFAEERATLSRFVVDHDLDNIVMLAGDAHMIAADDGTNSNYSGLPGAGFPVLQAGPIDQRSSIKGGPYSEGVVAEPGQFGWVRVEDDGDRLVVSFEGRDAFGEPVLTYQWEAPPP